MRSKYATRCAEGSNIVVFDADVAEMFPNAQAVDDALRALAHIIRTYNRVEDAA